MKKHIFSLIFLAASLTAQAQNSDADTPYRRSSLYSILVNIAVR